MTTLLTAILLVANLFVLGFALRLAGRIVREAQAAKQARAEARALLLRAQQTQNRADQRLTAGRQRAAHQTWYDMVMN